jgi:hypothetical protein
MKHTKLVLILIIGLLLPALLASQTAGDALKSMVTETAEMLVRELGREGEAAVEIGLIRHEGRPVVLGEYLEASLPVRLSQRPGHRLTVFSRPESGDYLLQGKLFLIGQRYELYLSLSDAEGRILAGREFEFPADAEMEKMAAPVLSGIAGGDRYEPDSEASALDVNPGETVSGRTLNPGGDVDWYRFENPGEETAVLTVFTAGDLDTYIEVYDEIDLFTPLAENDDGQDSNARISVAIEPGRVLLAAVRGYDSSETGEYQLASRMETLPDEPSEPDNSMQNAGELSVGEVLTRRIFPTGDVDWYRIRIPRSAGQEELYLDLRAMGDLDTYMEFFSADGEILAENDDGGGDNNARILYGPVRPGEEYLLQLRHYDGSDVGEYRIEATLSRPLHDQYESDNSWDEARETRLPAQGALEQERSFSIPSDVDWLRFSISSPRTLTLLTKGDADTLLRLFDAGGEVLEESDDYGDDYNGRIRRFLAPGEYRLEVSQYADDAQAGMEYRLLISVE